MLLDWRSKVGDWGCRSRIAALDCGMLGYMSCVSREGNGRGKYFSHVGFEGGGFGSETRIA